MAYQEQDKISQRCISCGEIVKNVVMTHSRPNSCATMAANVVMLMNEIPYTRLAQMIMGFRQNKKGRREIVRRSTDGSLLGQQDNSLIYDGFFGVGTSSKTSTCCEDVPDLDSSGAGAILGRSPMNFVSGMKKNMVNIFAPKHIARIQKAHAGPRPWMMNEDNTGPRLAAANTESP